VWDSGEDTTNLTSITVPPGNLIPGTTYYWHVTHQDGGGLWSTYSAETSFTTEESNTWIIIVAVVGGVVVALLVYFLVLRRRKKPAAA
jgi:LPXTG-motif cell wall-anchored protein